MQGKPSRGPSALMHEAIKSSVTVVVSQWTYSKIESANRCEKFQEGIYNQLKNKFSGRLCHEYIHVVKHFLGVMPGIVLGAEINADEQTFSAQKELLESSEEADLLIDCFSFDWRNDSGRDNMDIPSQPAGER